MKTALHTHRRGFGQKEAAQILAKAQPNGLRPGVEDMELSVH